MLYSDAYSHLGWEEKVTVENKHTLNYCLYVSTELCCLETHCFCFSIELNVIMFECETLVSLE